MSKQKKHDQLGMNPSTAAHKLRKDILFQFVQRSGEDVCFQCGAKIETVKELSIEHKTPWLDSEDPPSLFFDLDNIAYSHLTCNSGAARKPEKKETPHGTSRGYDYYGCRCVDCKTAKACRGKADYTPEKRRARYLRVGS